MGLALLPILGGQTTHEVTITDDDAAPTVQFSGPNSATADESAANHTVTLTLSAASGLTVTVELSDELTGSATSGTDYTAIGTPVLVTVAAGTTTQTVDIAILADAIDENNETIDLVISNPGNAGLGGQTTHEVTITDDDAAPTVP